MKSPLRKRLPRELKSEIGKYLAVLILMTVSYTHLTLPTTERV